MLTALIIIAIIGFAVWLLVTNVPMPAPFKQVIIAVAVIGLIIWLLSGPGTLPRIG